MNEELIAKLNAAVDKVGQWVQDAEAFAREQAPIVVQEVLAWGWWHHAILASAFLLGAIICWVATWVIFRWANNSLDSVDEPVAKILSSVFIGGGSAGFLVGVVANIITMAQISVAPRVYLLEQLGVLK